MQIELQNRSNDVQAPSANTTPTAARVGQWVARRRPEPTPATSVKESDISVADLATMKPHN
jgi:hypothetical protein